MATAEITRPAASLVGTFDHPAELSERERLLDARAEASSRVLVERVAWVRARGRRVGFKYRDNGDPLPDWFGAVVQGFANLLTLPDNWDGEGAHIIDRSAVSRALDAIDQLLDRHAPAPSIVPTPGSGLQIEWHRGRKDIEIEFRPDGGTHLYFFDQASGEEYEGTAGNSLAPAKEYLRRVFNG